MIDWIEVIHAGGTAALVVIGIYIATRVRRTDIREIAEEIRAERHDLKEAIKLMGEELQMFVKEQILDHEANHHGLNKDRHYPPGDKP